MSRAFSRSPPCAVVARSSQLASSARRAGRRILTQRGRIEPETAVASRHRVAVPISSGVAEEQRRQQTWSQPVERRNQLRRRLAVAQDAEVGRIVRPRRVDARRATRYRGSVVRERGRARPPRRSALAATSGRMACALVAAIFARRRRYRLRPGKSSFSAMSRLSQSVRLAGSTARPSTCVLHFLASRAGRACALRSPVSESLRPPPLLEVCSANR